MIKTHSPLYNTVTGRRQKTNMKEYVTLSKQA